MAGKTKIAVIYGGISGEHEVSLMSALSVCKHLDKNLFELLPIAIDKEGQWWLNDSEEILSRCERACFIRGERSQPLNVSLSLAPGAQNLASICDVAFPVLHGPLYEDGTLQGVLVHSAIPYVGCGVLSSAISMDKYLQKILLEREGVSVAKSHLLYKKRWEIDPDPYLSKILTDSTFPLFVKPNTLGSSVGIDRVNDEAMLRTAVEIAFQYDEMVLVEEYIDGLEIELSVLESLESGTEPLVSVPGEISVKQSGYDFYSYDAKYDPDSNVQLNIPAALSESQTHEAQQIAKRVFEALRCEGMARVDLFFDPQSEQFYFNEANTIPGFTTISMYPKLMAATGVEYPELLTRLISLAAQRFERALQIKRDWSE